MRNHKRNRVIAAGLGVFFGLLAFYYVNYIHAPKNAGIGIAVAAREIPRGVPLKESMVELTYTAEPFIHKSMIRESELPSYLGRQTQVKISKGQFLAKNNFSP